MPQEKPATTSYPINKLIRDRWSPRAFDPNKPVEIEKIGSILEAARWAASSYNEQPWRFVIATKDQPELYEKIFDSLVEANRSWARHAQVLMLTFISTIFAKNEKPNRVAIHDLGLAMGNLSLQATELGLVVHQMAGVDLDHASKVFDVPKNFKPVTAAAIGYQGDVSNLSEDWQREAEAQPRDRKPLSELLIGESWDKPSPLKL